MVFVKVVCQTLSSWKGLLLFTSSPHVSELLNTPSPSHIRLLNVNYLE